MTAATAVDGLLSSEQARWFEELSAVLGRAGFDLTVGELRREDSAVSPPEWRPDELMVAEVSATPKSFVHMTKLSSADRAWLVAGLSVRGMVAEEIADRTHCSLRLIRTIRSWEMTQVCRWVHERTAVLEAELSGERSQHSHTRRELEESGRRESRLRGQVDQLVAKLSAGEKVAKFRCGHLMVDWNTYIQRGVDGEGREFSREFCRECNNARAARYRERRKALGKRGAHTTRVTKLHAAVGVSA